MKIKFSAFLIFFLNCASLSQADQDIHVLLKGKVKDQGGRGIAGVMVTDGTNCIQTDIKGNYRLQSTDEALFVYITIPSGYEIPAENFIAEFYHKIRPVIGFDPDAAKYMESENKTGPYSWIKPRLTDYLFFANPSTGSNEIKIVASDRFGQQYTDRIKLKSD